MSERLVPQIRVNGFDGEWEQTQLGAVAALNPSGQLPDTFEYVDLASVMGTALIGHRTESRTSAPSRAQRLARPGDLFYQMVRPYQRNNYLFRGAREPYVFSTGYAQLRPTVNSEFLFAAIHRDEFVHGVLDRCTGTSYPAIAPSDLVEMPVSVPVSLPEQEAIGSLFADLDASIDQHRRKHQQLKQTKASLMERMFPAPGETVPQVRFDGCDGEWGYQSLGDFDIKTGPFGSALHAEDYVAHGTPIVTTEHFKSGHLPQVGTGVPQVSTSDRLRLSSYSLRIGDIVFSRVGSVDLNALVTPLQEGWLFSGRVLRVRPDGACDSAYLHYALETEAVRQSILARAVGQTMPSINTQILGATEVPMPEDRGEQQAIGEFFAKLDALIEAEQHRVEKLQQVKAALLQKMFV